MSLTRFLQNKDVKEKFSQEFTMPKLDLREEILAPPVTRNYGLVGTAFDYLLRFYIKQINPEAVTSRWIAEYAVMRFILLRAENAMINGQTMDEIIGYDTIISEDDRQLLEKFVGIISVAKANYSKYLKSAVVNDELIRSAILLAQLDVYFRSLVIVENIGTVDEGDITDMRNLFSIIPPSAFKARQLCILNPTFGEASVLIRGGDADLVIDDVLIDIKTTKFPEFRRDYFNQVIGYYILSRIGGIGGASPKSDIKNLGIYFSRFGVLRSMPVKEVVDEASLPSFIDWFKDRAIQEGSRGQPRRSVWDTEKPGG